MPDRSNQTVLSLLFGFLVCFAARPAVNADGRVFVLKLENSTGLLGFREAEQACASLQARLASPAELRHAVVECFFSLCTRGWLHGGTVGTTVCDGVGSALKAVEVKTENATEDAAHLDAFCIRDKGVPCGDPPSFPNARRQGHSGYEMGDELLYTCVPGYVMPSGHRAFSLLCDSCGEWYGLVEICVKGDTEGHIDYEDKFTDSYDAAERHNQRPEEAHGELYEGRGTTYENGKISPHQDTSASVEEGHQHQQREHEVEREVTIDKGEERAVGDFTGHPVWEQEAPKGGTTDVAAATEAPVSLLSQKHMFWFPSEAFQEEGHSVSPNPVTQITQRPPGIQSEESKENESQEMHHHQNPIDPDDHEHESDHYDDHEADDVDDHDDSHHDDHDDNTERNEEGHDDHLKHYIHTQHDDLDRWDHHRNQDDHDDHYDMGEHEDDRGQSHYGNRGNDDQDDPYDEQESYEDHEDVTEDQDDNDQEDIDGTKEPPDHNDHVDSEEHYGHVEDDNDHDDQDNHEDHENHDDRDDHNNHNDRDDDNDDRDEHDDRDDHKDYNDHDDHDDHDNHGDHNDRDDQHDQDDHDDHDDDSYPDNHDDLDDLHDHEHNDRDNYEDNDSHEDVKDGQHVILSIARDDERKAPTDETWLDGYPVVATEIENGNSEMERPEAGEKETVKLPGELSEAEILGETEAPKSPTRETVSKLGGVEEMWPGFVRTTAPSSESDMLDSHLAAPTHLTKQPFIQQNPVPSPGDIVTEEHSMPNLPGESGERSEMEGEMGEAICTGENCPPPTPSSQGPKVAVIIVVACLIAIAVMVGVWCYRRQQQKSSVYEMNGKRQSQSRNNQQIEMQQKV